jgi:hypothetical protein
MRRDHFRSRSTIPRVIRRLLNLLAAVSLLLCVATVSLWAAGGWDSGPRVRHLAGRWGYVIGRWEERSGSCPQLILYHDTQPVYGPIVPMGSSPQWDAWNKRYPLHLEWYGCGIQFVYEPSLGTDVTRRATMFGSTFRLIAPYWMLATAFLILPAIAWSPRFMRRRAQLEGRCAICGYDLRATPERCPECGTSAQPRANTNADSPSAPDLIES